MPFNVERATALRVDSDQAERTDAFVARFGRLQDTKADKLLPEFLRCLAEPIGAAIDNLDRAEKLGLLDSADDWLASRKLRNQMVRMVHEYVRDAAPLRQTSCRLPFHADDPRRSDPTCKRINIRQSS